MSVEKNQQCEEKTAECVEKTESVEEKKMCALLLLLLLLFVVVEVLGSASAVGCDEAALMLDEFCCS